MKRDKEYFRKLFLYKKQIEDHFKKRGESLNKYQLATLVSIKMNPSLTQRGKINRGKFFT